MSHFGCIFFKSPLYGKSIEAKDPEGLVNLEPKGMVGMIYVGDQQTLLYTVCIQAVGLMVME